MGQYTEDVKELLRLVGGKENIAAVSHCMTRMRFALVDQSKADIKAIEAMKVVSGSFTQSGQFQVIIGNGVATFYNEFVNNAGIDSASKDSVKKAAINNQNILQRIVTALAEIFAPLIPAIITGGLILGFRNCIDSIGFYENGTKTLVDVSVFWAGVDNFLWLIGEAVFHMLPVGICWSVTKKMRGTQMLGIVLGLTLVSGQLLNAYAVASTAVVDMPHWNFGFILINKIGYQAQVIPAILAAFTLVYLERFFRKITPQVISMVVVPFCSLLLSVMAAHFILGPIGWKIGSAISGVIYASITGSFKVIFGAIFGFFYAPLVITGLHHMSNAIDLQLIADSALKVADGTIKATQSGTQLWPMIALSNIAQGSAVMGMIILQRRNTLAQEINVPAAISCYLGVTEPAMFGVNLKYGFPFLCGMIGSACAAILCVSTSTTATSIGVGGLPGILSIQIPYMYSFALCMLVAIVVPLFLTVVIGSKKLLLADRTGLPDNELDDIIISKEKNAAKEAKIIASMDKNLKAFLQGEVISLEKLNDGVFSKGLLGSGLAIIPENETVFSPVDAEVTVLMQTSKHACGLKLANGLELLLHVGLDTVAMEGDGFTYHITAGQKVKQGDPLISFDRKKIKDAGYQDTTICVLTEEGEAKNISYVTGINATAKETTIITFE